MGKASREVLGTRLGFLLLSAGCAIGLGNIWRFPYITGLYGGAAFVIIYLCCLLAVTPILIMEIAVGRAARCNMGQALRKLEPEGTKWHRFGWLALVGSYLLMMFYTVVTGWLLSYCWFAFSGQLSHLDPAGVGAFFGRTLADTRVQVIGMSVTVAVGCLVCSLGVRKGIERIVKLMMAGLFLILILLVFRSLTLPGAGEGVSFYLAPDFGRLFDKGFFSACNAALNQAFFTISVGIGSMTIFGSYQPDNRSLAGEGAWIVTMDTFVAIMAGLVIFPACFAFGVDAGGGPGLIFVTLPNIFNAMDGGRIWGILFFVFMAFAALSTVIAVFENIISYSIDVWGMSRRTSSILHFVGLWVCSLPCALGFNIWADFQPLGKGTSVLDLEDFLISNNLLFVGTLMFLFFCCTRWGWGWKNFLAEANKGEGLKFPHWLKGYLTYVLPCLIIIVFVMGYVERLSK